jgi:hypothetical protein
MGEWSSGLSDNPINEAKGSPKRQKLRTQINGKLNDMSISDENK